MCSAIVVVNVKMSVVRLIILDSVTGFENLRCAYLVIDNEMAIYTHLYCLYCLLLWRSTVVPYQI